MADNVLATLFQDQADAIREGLGEDIGKIKPVDFPARTREIVALIGGGSSEDVRYVTFMSHDGTVEYGKKAVAVGDDCADPIARGIFDTPTRESTVQYDYTFAGWATKSGGSASASALSSVSEDRSVYAAYTSAVRYYTISYYDGETLLTTQQVAYGSTPSYSPTKDGYNFTGWEPEVVAVTGDASYYAQWEEKAKFALLTWSEIAEIAESGNAANTFSVGDTREGTVNGETVVYEIIGFDHDDLADGSGKAGITIMANYVPSFTLHNFDSATTTTNPKYWGNSELRTFCNGDLFNALETDLQNVIKPVTKKSDYGTYSTGLNITTDKVFVLAYEELRASGIASNHSSMVTAGQGSLYAMWKNFWALKTRYNADGTAVYYWTRTHSILYSETAFFATSNDTIAYSPYNDQTAGFFTMYAFCI